MARNSSLMPFLFLGGAVLIGGGIAAVVIATRRTQAAPDATLGSGVAPAGSPPLARPQLSPELAAIVQTLGPLPKFKPVESPVHWRIDDVVAAGVKSVGDKAASTFAGDLNSILKGASE